MAGMKVMSLKQCLDQFWKSNTVLHDLLGSLKEAILEEDLENQNKGGSSILAKKGSGSTGYQEVKNCQYQ